MANPIVIAYHLIWTAYGWWLANDPRGSMSETIRCDVFCDLAELHYGRKRVQPAGWVIRDFYREAAKRLKHELLTFDERARAEIAMAFENVIRRERLTVYACAIMPDHIHLVVRKHRLKAEEMIALFQEESRLRLRVERPWTSDHPVWGGHGWVVFLDHPDEVERTDAYVENNPKTIGWPAQLWPFVTSYDGWPLHPGHSENSPYVKRLKTAGRHP
jgi:REP element-mobilizing transposase RayT